MKIICQSESKRDVALVTGATSGIGREIARLLRSRGYDLIITGRDEDELMRLSAELGHGNTTAVSADLSSEKECFELYKAVRRYPVMILVNSAGFGVYGEFSEVSLRKELDMINVDIRAVHILMKLFLRDFIKRDRGYILNVSSAAAFMPGPFMSGYYASKSYVLRQSEAVSEELRRRRSRVSISILCPGPVRTDFNRRAGVSSGFKGITAQKAAKAGVDGMFAHRLVIVPGAGMTLVTALSGMLPVKLVTAVNYSVQAMKKRDL